MLLTIFLALVCCASITTLLVAAVAFVQETKFFSSAPKEVRSLFEPRDKELFYGAKLSGGERQRISIARALLKNAPIVLLDEATASLDVENETKVQGALSRLLSGKTVLVIAHRMRTVEAADKIVVLSDGKVAEEGSPAELFAKENSLFRRMTQLQNASAGWSI